jgi:DNA-binding NarL/FixJ family response regulator
VSPVRVMVVDDHALFRRGLISLLSEMPEIEVAGEAENGREALTIIRETAPDVVLLDVNMPVLDGVETVEALKADKFPGQILMLTISKHEEDLMGAITAGADGYLLKNIEPQELKQALLDVAGGKGVLSPDITRQVLKAVSLPPDQRSTGGLSKRERQVLEALAQGSTTAEIGRQLFISDNTVKTHVRHILEKLDASNRTEAVRKALQAGLIRSD